jgi:outer membrane biosynthesis protein TonB
MLKKIVTAVFASALTFALAAPAALACPDHADETAKEEKEQPGVIAQEDESKPAEEAPKVEKKQQPKKAEKVAKKQKRPVRVAKN